jgi:energy-coupling factor transporter ATP-binding protein EcfA2
MIKKIKIQNVKAIENFEAEFDVNAIYVIKGENDTGKSTFLNIISGLLEGSLNKHELLRTGEEKGFIEAETENFTIRCDFGKNKSGKITLTEKNTGLVSTKKSQFEQIFGYHDFDAEMFVRWSETAQGRRDQINQIKSLFPESVIKRINEIELLIESTKETRKPINREIERLDNLLAEIKVNPEIKEPIIVDDLIQEKNNIIKSNDAIEKAKSTLEQIERAKEDKCYEIGMIESDAKNEIAILEAKIKEVKEKAKLKTEFLNKELSEISSRIKKGKEYLKDKKIVDFSDIDEKIRNAQTINSQFEKNKKHSEYSTLYSESKTKKDELEKSIENLLAEKTKLLQENEPVKGLTFDEEKLYLNGIPFDNTNISDSEKLRVGFEIQVLKNPKAKIFMIARGESIGKEKRKAIYEFAKQNGYQGFIEVMQYGQNELSSEIYEYSE